MQFHDSHRFVPVEAWMRETWDIECRSMQQTLMCEVIGYERGSLIAIAVPKSGLGRRVNFANDERRRVPSQGTIAFGSIGGYYKGGNIHLAHRNVRRCHIYGGFSWCDYTSSRTLSCAFVSAIFIRFGSPRTKASANFKA